MNMLLILSLGLPSFCREKTEKVIADKNDISDPFSVSSLPDIQSTIKIKPRIKSQKQVN